MVNGRYEGETITAGEEKIGEINKMKEEHDGGIF